MLCPYLTSLLCRDKKKEFAPNSAAFYPFGVDVFLSPRKINHIARFVELPAIDSSGEIPPILIVNLQVLYTLFSLDCLVRIGGFLQEYRNSQHIP